MAPIGVGKSRLVAMSLKQMQYFLILSEELHYGRAAARLNISQPPLSHSIKQLEQDLGTKLLERDTQGTRLTSAGVVFAERVGTILGQIEAARTSVLDLATGMDGMVHVGFLPSMIYRNIFPVIKEFRREFKNIDVSLYEYNSSDQLDSLMRHEIDVGFIHAVPLPDTVQSATLQRERFVCCLPRGHRLVTRSQICIEDLHGERVLMFSRARSKFYHDHILALLRAVDVEPDLNYHIQHWFTVIAMISQGLGISIVPQSIARSDIGSSDVVFIELADKNAFHELSLIWRKSDTEAESGTAAAFVTFARNYYLTAHRSEPEF